MNEHNKERVCPKCGADMELGFLLDSSQANRIPTTWVEGLPKRSFFHLASIKGKTLRKVNAYRCVECGFLECYATEEWKGWPRQ